jgi:hypothetical protein
MHASRKSLQKALTPLALALVCQSCGGTNNDAEYCLFDVTSSGVTTESTRTIIELQGELPPSCETLTRENVGKLVVEIRLSGDASPSTGLAEVEAGSRRKDFNPEVANLRAGSLDAQFSSQSEPDWSVPWEDRPETFKVALSAPLGTISSAAPQRATVRLSL